ncbi:Glycosyl hydrolase, family 65 [Spiroplasma clarkii]|uniref:Alpha,alpha-trehalose phosphorylase n=1 Tax=Spiroplasma clarkii TaxID=2139 RepID=A0A1Y0L2B7_9MOLU|nr:glycoside hydrolase family 65 protein [Spiroplasma clarkii]ARU92174.1 Glycosyl hydrolase, family 65 [Spiroplasma clarkii]ATX71505.1 alpha,alpha-trehalose phosphorylase [Spiroplasma clarkii]
MSMQIKYTDFKPQNRKVEESNLSISNGYLGMRGSFEEGIVTEIPSIEGTYINAFYDYFDIQYAAKYTGYPDLYQRMMPIVNVQNIEIFIDQNRYLFSPNDIKDYELVLDMSSGELKRKYIYQLNDQESISFSFKKMLSQTNFELFLQNISFEFNFKTERQVTLKFPLIFKELSLDKGVPNDPRAGLVDVEAFKLIEKQVKGPVGGIVYETQRSHKSFCYATKIMGLTGFLATSDAEGLIFTKKISKQTVELYKVSVVSEQNFAPVTLVDSFKKLEIFSQLSYEQHVKNSKEYFRDFWNRADSHFGAKNVALLEPNNFNMFQLYTNIGKLPWTNVAAKGLTGEGYAGHYFWDSEIYIITALTLFDAKLAKAMLQFRYNTLPQARERAKIMGHPKGALYPWRTINGEETSTYYPAGTAQYHINGDIAFTVVNYYKATKDIEFLFESGLEILIETARLYEDKIVVYEGQAHINGVTGPDEYQILVNDDYWTNCVAEFNLNWAHQAHQVLKTIDEKRANKKLKALGSSIAELECFTQLGAKIYHGYDSKLDLNPQHDNFMKRKPVDRNYIDKYKPFLRTLHPLSINTLRVTKQADVVLANLFFYKKNSQQTMINNWNFYDETDTADSSLSKCIYAIMAARLRIKDYGFEYFKETINLDLYDTHKNTDRGLHMANMGGARMFVIYGLLGINIEAEYLEINPCYNEIIDAYDVKVEYQGALLDFELKDKKLIIKNLTKQTVTIKYNEHLYEVSVELELKI